MVVVVVVVVVVVEWINVRSVAGRHGEAHHRVVLRMHGRLAVFPFLFLPPSPLLFPFLPLADTGCGFE